jgi:hypothetical protein
MNKLSADVPADLRESTEMDSDVALYPATFAITKRPSPKERFKEVQPILLFFAACFVFGFVLPPLTIFLTPIWLASNYLLYMSATFFIGFAAALAGVVTIRLVSRHVLNGHCKKIEILEKRLSTGSPDVLGDLDALITANMKAGRAPVAEFYSKQLLALCERDPNEELTAEIMLSSPCWVSTPDYHKSVSYWLIWLYESRGLLCLTSEHLEYESTRLAFRVSLKDIVDISVERHPLWMKPYPLRYIKLSFREPDFGSIVTMYLSPYTMQTDTVFDINKTVQEWYTNLTKTLGKVC